MQLVFEGSSQENHSDDKKGKTDVETPIVVMVSFMSLIVDVKKKKGKTANVVKDWPQAHLGFEYTMITTGEASGDVVVHIPPNKFT